MGLMSGPRKLAETNHLCEVVFIKKLARTCIKIDFRGGRCLTAEPSASVGLNFV